MNSVDNCLILAYIYRYIYRNISIFLKMLDPQLLDLGCALAKNSWSGSWKLEHIRRRFTGLEACDSIFYAQNKLMFHLFCVVNVNVSIFLYCMIYFVLR
jgi:hypothetical protein